MVKQSQIRKENEKTIFKKFSKIPLRVFGKIIVGSATSVILVSIVMILWDIMGVI